MAWFVRDREYDLNDFRKDLRRLERPVWPWAPPDVEGQRLLRRLRGMIDAMTEQERRSPDLIDRSRRQRIAAGSGASAVEVKEFLANFRQVRASRREMPQWSLWQRIKAALGALFSGFPSAGC